MIEINLLPPQYRTVERTPLPVFLGLIGGIVVVAILALTWVALDAQRRKLDEQKASVAALRDKKAAEVEVVKKLERELKESQGRIDTVLSIAESKIYWAYKLDNLVKILPSYAWIESLSFDLGTGKLQLACKARGTSYQRYTELKQRFRNDTNFMYHFDQIPLTNVDVVNPGPMYLEPQVLSFGLTLPLREVEQIAAQPKK